VPTYDYECPATGEVVEVRHGMMESLETWGQLCARAEQPLGSTPPDAPVRRKLSGGNLMVKGGAAPPPSPSAGGGGCRPSCGCC
jgi:predicted nucleic acid-binding Zn ribbon protein